MKPTAGGGGYTHRDFTVGHEDGEVAEMVAGTCSVSLIGSEELTALGGPVSHHAPLGIVPERAVGVEVIFRLRSKRFPVHLRVGLLKENDKIKHGGGQ